MTRTTVALALLAAAACAPRTHLTETHGRSTRAVFDRQQANPGAVGQAPKGLDSQEAAIVAGTYREGLAPKGEATRDAPVLLVNPQGQSQGTQQRALAPSVPQQPR